ncbi:DUF5665 domain-containing protein [Gymnodinialimonas sp. 57CJ19]|uniref:DUF5665 domain-containing protein n=1 Tax=Gymnodinialimonas sp. 57CJ19 TaxID=3138498 RepID=UPI00313451B1
MPDTETDPAAPQPPRLEDEVRALREELSFLRQHRMFQVYQSVPRILLLRFAVGMAVGLGTVIGATVLLSIIVWALSQIEFLPIIGAWSVEIARQIEAAVGG